MRMLRSWFGGSLLRTAITTALAAGLGLVPANAATIYGALNFGGSVAVNLTTIDFLPLGLGTGTIDFKEPSTGYFAGLGATPPDVTGVIDDLTPGNPPPVTPWIYGLAGNVPPALVGLVFNLQTILAPVGPLCTAGDPGVGNSCQFGVFNLLNTGGGDTTITLRVIGEFVNGADSGVARGRFTTQRAQSITDIVNEINRGGTITESFSANFSSVPEPGTLGLIGVAFIAAGLTRKFRS